MDDEKTFATLIRHLQATGPPTTGLTCRDIQSTKSLSSSKTCIYQRVLPTAFTYSHFVICILCTIVQSRMCQPNILMSELDGSEMYGHTGSWYLLAYRIPARRFQ